jgi:chromosome transmission fidelity protein 1
MVVLIGLPYPNRSDPILREKLHYLEMKNGKGAGQQYYETLCMRAVNQAIGRAIRHKNDYAAIVLIDTR